MSNDVCEANNDNRDMSNDNGEANNDKREVINQTGKVNIEIRTTLKILSFVFRTPTSLTLKLN